MPILGPDYHAFLLFKSVCDAAPPSGLLFAGHDVTLPALGEAVKNATTAVRYTPPPGFAFSGNSPQSGGVSAAYSVGVQLDRIVALPGHSSEVTMRKHYPDTAIESCPDVRMFFRRRRRRS